MAYTRSWDETQPVDHLQLNKVPFWDRAIRVDIAERLKDFFYGFIVGENEVGAKKIDFVKQSTSPNAVANKGIIFTKEVDGEVELFYKSASGKEKQITNKGELNVPSAFESGDILLTTRTTVAEGWEDISSTYDNKFIRISSGTPLDTGGSDTHSHEAGTYTAASHRHSLPATTGAIHQVDVGPALCDCVDCRGHTHDLGGYTGYSSAAVTGTSASAENIPAYIQIRMWRKL